MFCKNIVLLLLILLLNVDSFSQESSDTVAYVFKYPVREGYIYFYKERPGSLATPVPYVFIYSKENKVFAFMEGEVKRTFKIGDEVDDDYILIKNKDTAVVYGNMNVIYKKVGDTVRRGELLGELKKDIEGTYDRYELIFGIMVKLKSLIYPEYIDFFKQY